MKTIIFEVVREKTGIIGYWQNKDKKLYIDYIKTYMPKNELDYHTKIEQLFFSGELCIFVKAKNNAYIVCPCGKYEVLSKKIVLKFELLTDGIINLLLKKYSGFTYYKNLGIVEVWQ